MRSRSTKDWPKLSTGTEGNIVDPATVSPEVWAKIQLWKPHDADTWPDWYVWTGGWYEMDGETTYYVNWDNLGDNAIVFDIGCYEGKWLDAMCTKYPNYHYYGFDPAPRALKVAVARLCSCKHTNLYNFGLGAQAGMFPLRDYNRDSATFMLPHEYTDPNYPEEMDAEIVDIAQFLESESITCIDLMTINIEGMEFELIPHIIKTGIVHRVKNFMIQWHSGVKDAGVQQQLIQSQLAQTHHMTWNLGAWEAWKIGSRPLLDSSQEPSTSSTLDIS